MGDGRVSSTHLRAGWARPTSGRYGSSGEQQGHENVLADAGTRQHDKEFRGLARQYLSDHPRDWLERERRRWPAQLPARPELLPLVPVVHAHVLDTMDE